MEFREFPKIPRLSREIIITEKIDGTNASVYIDIPTGIFLCGSRTRWITPENDNYGFAKWAYEHKEELCVGLGDGHHFGEWWGAGIQRKYGRTEKRFSLFNTSRWQGNGPCPDQPGAVPPPSCCSVVPVLGTYFTFKSVYIEDCLSLLKQCGSQAAPGFMNPEGIVIYHTAAKQYFKKTIEKDDAGKGKET